MVACAVSDALGVRVPADRVAADTIVEHLRHQTVLLVLDNCEHVVAAVAALADRVLRSCKDVTVLTTSRVPLAVEGEGTWRSPSLAVPPASAADVYAVRQYDAGRLFIGRAL